MQPFLSDSQFDGYFTKDIAYLSSYLVLACIVVIVLTRYLLKSRLLQRNGYCKAKKILLQQRPMN